MIDRKMIKQRGKAAFLANFWLCVAVALVLTVLVSGGAGLGSGISSSFNVSDRNIDFSSFTDPAAMENFDAQRFFDEFMSNGGGVFAGVLFGVAAVASLIGIAINIFLGGPLKVGGCRFFLENGERPAQFDTILFPFRSSYMNIVKTMFLQDLIIALWSLLFIIPGVVKSYAYRLVPYILAEAPEIDAAEARRRSEEMMKGHKWEAFVFDLSFFGWYLLCVCTCGILAIFYVNPYVFAADAELYRAIKYINFGGYVPPMPGTQPPAGDPSAQYYAPYDGQQPQQPYGQQTYYAPQQPYGQQYGAPQDPPRYPYAQQNAGQYPYTGRYPAPEKDDVHDGDEKRDPSADPEA